MNTPSNAQESEVESALDTAVIHFEAGRIAEAEELCAVVIQREPENFKALHLRGNCERQRGDLGKAERTLLGATASRPDSALAHLDYGRVLVQLGRAPQALAAFLRAAELDPTLGTAHHNAGAVLESMGRFAEAITQFEKSDATRRNISSLVGGANCLVALGHGDAAIAAYRRVLELDPGNADANSNLAAALLARGDLLAAWSHLERALATNPQHAGANRNHVQVWETLTTRVDSFLSLHAQTGNGGLDEANVTDTVRTMLALRRIDDIVALFDSVPAGQSGSWELRMLCVTALIRGPGADRAEETLAQLETLRRESPDNADLPIYIGSVWESLGDDANAASSYRSALGSSQDRIAQFRLARLALKEGKAADAWSAWRFRWDDPDSGATRRFFPVPEWDAREVISDQTLLVYCESGIADAILFGRLVPLLKGKARKIMLETDPGLAGIFSRLFGDEVAVLAKGKALPTFDRHCALSDLLPLLCPDPTAVPALPANASADSARVPIWRDRVARSSVLRVGLVSAGELPRTNRAQARVPASELVTQLQRFGASRNRELELFLLHDELPASERETLANARNLRTFGRSIENLEDFAALIALCDCIVGVDAPATHLAAAMGKPTVFLLADGASWQWLQAASKTSWYPSASLLRKVGTHAWSQVLPELQHLLHALVP
jgi:tetratricopeptide (TPR) repeat protein